MSAAGILAAAGEAGLLDAGECAAILAESRRLGRDPLGLAAGRLRLPPEAFYRALAAARSLPFLEGAQLRPDPELLARAPASLLERKPLLPLRREPGGQVLVAVADPDDVTARSSLQRRLGAPLRLAVAEPSAIRAAREGLAGGGAPAFDATRCLDRLLREAYLRRASDLHLDPQACGLVPRLRVDGRLRACGPPLGTTPAAQLLSRIKVLAGMDIAERRSPQDGSFRHEPADAPCLDLRVATIPTRLGERATLRLLGAETRELSLERIGFPTATLVELRRTLARPHGLVLLSGPTGSGKTTTLYAALRELADPERNLLSVEDPVEQLLPGATQVAVDRVGKVTFASALRALLRHDPDVLMVGEVRDAETAQVAVRAAATGHLVLSSVHSGRAAGAVSRLVDLGCRPRMLAATLTAVLAQRLVRRLCPSCRRARAPRPGELRDLGAEEDPALQLQEAAGCPACLGSGYRGRVALSEPLWLDQELGAAVAAGAGEAQLSAAMRARGWPSLRDDARAKVLAGTTSCEEVRRVIG